MKIIAQSVGKGWSMKMISYFFTFMIGGLMGVILMAICVVSESNDD